MYSGSGPGTLLPPHPSPPLLPRTSGTVWRHFGCHILVGNGELLASGETGQPLAHTLVHRTGPTASNCPAPKVSRAWAEKPCSCMEHTLLHFSTLAGPPETDVASMRDAEVPGRGFWKETVAVLWGERRWSPAQQTHLGTELRNCFHMAIMTTEFPK